MTCADTRMEAEIKELGLTAPRVEKEHIDKLVEELEFEVTFVPDSTVTVAVAFHRIGPIRFMLACETLACVDPSNFSEELGRKYGIEKARAAAREKLWELEGYSLAKSLYLLPKI